MQKIVLVNRQSNVSLHEKFLSRPCPNVKLTDDHSNEKKSVII